MVTFKSVYFLFFSLLLVTEIAIAWYVPDGFIRHYFGDALVVILMYCFILSFLKLPVIPTALGVLLFAYGIEILQYCNLVDKFGLNESGVASIVLGSTFDWMDMLMYTLGIAFTLVVEKWRNNPSVNFKF